MSLAPLIVSAAALSAAFAPPVGQDLRYTTIETRPLRHGTARIVLHQTIRFTLAGEGYEATTVPTAHEVEAPEPYRSLMDAPFGPFHGVETRVRMDRSGTIVGVIGGEQVWARVKAAHDVQLARIDSDPAVPSQGRAMAHSVIASALGNLPPAARDARLADAVAALLAPTLPAMAPGQTRPFVAKLGPGPASSSGTVSLISADAAILTYRIETRSDPVANEGALAALEARLRDAPPDQRAKIAAGMAAARATIDRQVTDLQVERATGLLLRARTERTAQAADGTSANVGISETVLER